MNTLLVASQPTTSSTSISRVKANDSASARPKGRIWRQGYRVMTVQLFPHLIRGARLASLPLAGFPRHSR